MIPELDALLRELEPHTDANLELRLRFGLSCARRVSHLLERPEVIEGLAALERVLAAPAGLNELPALAARLAELANSHQGSRSIDGVGHAAVSATYACAKAMEGKARQAAEYAAYAMVYGEGGYGATSDPSAFDPEYKWQAAKLRELLSGQPVAAGTA